MKRSIITLLSVISLMLIVSVNLPAQGATAKKSGYTMTLPEFKEYFSKLKLDGYKFHNAANNGHGGYNAIFKDSKHVGSTIVFDLLPHEAFLTYKTISGNKTPWKREVYLRKGLKSYFLDINAGKCIVVEATNLGGTFAIVSYGTLLEKKALEKLLDKSGFYSIKK